MWWNCFVDRMRLKVKNSRSRESIMIRHENTNRFLATIVRRISRSESKRVGERVFLFSSLKNVQVTLSFHRPLQIYFVNLNSLWSSSPVPSFNTVVSRASLIQLPELTVKQWSEKLVPATLLTLCYCTANLQLQLSTFSFIYTSFPR